MFAALHKYELDFRLLWRGFVTISTYPNDSLRYYEIRIAGLQALQACLSMTLYSPPYVNVDEESVPTPNPSLMALYSQPYYPELLVSLICTVFYPEERNLLFTNNLFNKSSLEYDLHNAATKVLMIVLCGQLSHKSMQKVFSNKQHPDVCMTVDYFRGIPFPNRREQI
jgi:hypothetical protein